MSIRSASWLIFAVALACLATPVHAQSQVGGHAHNDFEHARPLLDAIDHGFISVEADIWLRDGQLLVGHDEADLDPTRTLQSLYVDPLEAVVAGKGGSVLGNAAPFTLLIDIKTEGEATYQALAAELVDYADFLTHIENGKLVAGAVTVVVSGNRPKSTMAAESLRLAFYDGRLGDLDSGLSPNFMPLVSDNWVKHFGWTGASEMPRAEQQKLLDIVARAHAAGYRVRFWGTPDAAGPQRDALWRTLADAGVDLINTDDLAGFSAFKR